MFWLVFSSTHTFITTRLTTQLFLLQLGSPRRKQRFPIFIVLQNDDHQIIKLKNLILVFLKRQCLALLSQIPRFGAAFELGRFKFNFYNNHLYNHQLVNRRTSSPLRQLFSGEYTLDIIQWGYPALQYSLAYSSSFTHWIKSLDSRAKLWGKWTFPLHCDDHGMMNSMVSLMIIRITGLNVESTWTSIL